MPPEFRPIFESSAVSVAESAAAGAMEDRNSCVPGSDHQIDHPIIRSPD
jgi:hypothetical protein